MSKFHYCVFGGRLLTVDRSPFEGGIQFSVVVSFVRRLSRASRLISQAKIHRESSEKSVEKREHPWHYIPVRLSEDSGLENIPWGYLVSIVFNVHRLVKWTDA